MNKLCKIRDIQRAVIKVEADFENLYGISLNEGMVLCSLSEGRPLSSGELCESLGISPSNTSKVIASVEKKGLVRRSLGRNDKRQMYFALTASGAALIDSVEYDKLDIPEIIGRMI